MGVLCESDFGGVIFLLVHSYRESVGYNGSRKIVRDQSMMKLLSNSSQRSNRFQFTPSREYPTMAHTECPDCGTTLRGIKLTDATERFWSEGTSRVDQQYAAEDSKAGFMFGIEAEGNIYGRLCTKCGRILLYAVPMND